ncbi:Receptor lectin kinase [Melia azedarach]|uniref:Receptor lectin kinase n=1 Tax=Melia azedarach TaxID=155640 RepID=A0ACC1XZA9_MELAZ|nr:Receptor lectin kinase [Melia azedarach]
MAICIDNRPLLFCFFMIVVSLIPLSSALYFNYSSFSPQYDDGIAYERAYPDSNRVIQLPDSPETAGRATYNKSMLLWDKATGNLTDFTTHFSFAIDSDKRLYFGDGMAFFLAPEGSKVPTNKGGGSFGLTSDDQPLNSTSNPFVAVEFDIFKNDWDPPGVHVGIDINSMKSVNNETWLSDIPGGRRNEAWINYDSRTHNLSVVFTGFRNNSTVMQYLDYQVDLRLYLTERVTFGFSMATGSAYAKYSIYSWEFRSTLEVDDNSPPSSSPESNRRRRRNKTTLAVGLSLGGGVLVGALLLGVWISGFGRKRNDEEDEENNHGLNEYIDDDFERGAGPKKFSYNELSRATNDFNDEQKLGQGGFGGVYKGFLRETNSYIAVKKVSKGSKQGIKEYASEVKIISRLRHRNLVQLLGWCHEKNQLLLVYEFLPNGSLDSHLFKENSLLTWEFRHKIAQDLASGLLYLQEEWEQCVVHRDIKSSNIMLDSNFNAKIGDFGLARLVEHAKGSQTTVLAGTMGYMAPECATTGKASKESDIYSFGIVALEIACGRKPINPRADEGQVYLVKWVWELYGRGNLLEAADPRLGGEFDEQQLQCLMIVGLWCAHPDENLRPSMKQAIHVLNFEAPLPNLPPRMPVPTYLSPPMNMLTIDAIIAEGSQDQISSSYNCNTNSSHLTSSSAASSSASLLHTH